MYVGFEPRTLVLAALMTTYALINYAGSYTMNIEKKETKMLLFTFLAKPLMMI